MKKDGTIVPCGKCPKCKARRVSGWSKRLMEEERYSSSAMFVTLTYDTDYVPITKKGFMSLDKRDFQLFMKRLRKLNKEKLKYYAVGEYGGKTMRPHYHIILFNATENSVFLAWIDVDDATPKGHIHYGKVEGASVGYTLKYINKPKKVPMHKNDDRVPEFALMSKGLGSVYLTTKMQAWHKADIGNRMYCIVDGNKKISMPRYYKDKLYTNEERKDIAEIMQKKYQEELDKKQLTEEFHQEYIAQKQNIKAAFERMHKNSIKNDKL